MTPLCARARRSAYSLTGFTYSGHPVAAAVGVETLKIYEERRILDHVRAVMPHFQGGCGNLGTIRLSAKPAVMGLIGAVELVRTSRRRNRSMLRWRPARSGRKWRWTTV